MFPLKEQHRYELKNYSPFSMTLAKWVYNSHKSVLYLVAKFMDTLSYELKEIESLIESKIRIKL